MKQAFRQIRELADSYQTPSDACRSYRALFEGLARLDTVVTSLVDREEYQVFPGALEIGTESVRRG